MKKCGECGCELTAMDAIAHNGVCEDCFNMDDEMTNAETIEAETYSWESE